MRKFTITIVIICLSLISYAQNREKLKTIADELIEYKTYQTVCEFTFSMPFGDTLTFESFITTKKIPADNLCGFHYSFETEENYRGKNFNDFSMYFDSTVYNSYLGIVKKTSYSESPSQFIDLKLENRYVPAIQKRSTLLMITPYGIGKLINKIVKDTTMIISQKTDTIIELDTCLHYIIESVNKSQISDKSNTNKSKGSKTIYEFCFNATDRYPVFFKEENYTSFVNSLQIAHFRNTRINNGLPVSFFSEENLLPMNWNNLDTAKIEREMNPEDLVGKKAPKWKLPILGTDEFYSSNSLKGKYSILEFTATWCGHCYSAAKMMNKLEDEYKENEDVKILSIFSSDYDKKKGIEKFAEKLNVKSTILYSASEVGEKYYVSGYPKFFIISPKGKVLKVIQGYGPTVKEDIISSISELLNNTPVHF